MWRADIGLFVGHPRRFGLLLRRSGDLYLAASRAFLGGALPPPPGLRGATEEFALYLARCALLKLRSTWAVGEGGAAGPGGNRYGDPAGYAWFAVSGPSESTRNLQTASADRRANMVTFAAAALTLLAEAVEAS